MLKIQIQNGGKKPSYRTLFSSGIIPLIFLISSFSGTLQLAHYESYEKDNLVERDTSFVDLENHMSAAPSENFGFSNLLSERIENNGQMVSEISPRSTSELAGETTTGSRATSGIDIAVSDQFDYDSIIKELPSFYSAGEVGKETTFTFWLENLGDTAGSNVKVYFKIFDYYNRLATSQDITIGTINPSGNIPIQFDWIPLYSNYYNVTLSVSAQDDTNSTNDKMYWRWVIAIRWSSDFESSDLSNWGGDIALSSQWHITDSIQDDPNSSAHSSPHALYHGEENINDDYGIGEDYYLTLPPFDLRRYNSSYPGTFLLYQFYGSSSSDKDELIMEVKSSPEKDFELSDLLPSLSGDTRNEQTSLLEWQAWRSPEAIFSGIPISFLVGDIVQFRFHWHSDNITENKPGFYFDDFLLFGLEEPPPDKDAGMEDLDLKISSNPWGMIVAGEQLEISVKVKNYGQSSLSNFNINLSIHDEQNRYVTKIVDPEKTIHSLGLDSEQILTWYFRPEICGNYHIRIENLLADDGWTKNDIIEETITVAKHFNSFEAEDELWSAEGGWRRVSVPNDPNPSGHSPTNTWYVGGENFTYKTNLNAVLTSPMIDLQGVNPSNPDIKVFTNFKFYGNTQDSDKLYFEYALDGSDDWQLVNDGGSLGADYSTLIYGYYGIGWFDIDQIKKVQVGSAEFVGHSVQFRWRFVSDNIFENLPGFFIDDFIVWAIEEDYGRPSVLDARISKNTLENHPGDFATVTARVLDRDDNLYSGGISIDLSSIGGNTSATMYDDGTNGDQQNADGTYSLNISADPKTGPGDYVLTIKVIDTDAKLGQGFVRLKIIENEVPRITAKYPTDHNLQMNENQTIEFSITAEDPGDRLKYQWSLNGDMVDEGDNLTEFEFVTSYDGELSAGLYYLNVTVFDDAKPPEQVSVEWEINVIDVLPDFELSRLNIQVSNTKPRPGETVYFNVTVKNIGDKPEKNVLLTASQNMSLIDDSLYKGIVEFDRSTFDLILPDSVTAPKSFNWIAIAGMHEFIFFVDPRNNITEINEYNNFVNVTIQVEEIPDIEQSKHDDQNIIWSTNYFIAIISVIIITTSAFGMAVGGTEIGRYRFFTMIAPLYSRLKGTKILSHQLREQIYNHIKQYPGDHYRSIMNKLKLKNGTLVHHLQRLEQEELIKSQKDGLYKRFYPIGMKIPQSNASMYYPDGTITYNISDRQVSEIQMNILRTLNEKPGASQKDISEAISESRRVVNYHIKLLEQSKLIKVVRHGRETKCYLQVDLT